MLESRLLASPAGRQDHAYALDLRNGIPVATWCRNAARVVAFGFPLSDWQLAASETRRFDGRNTRDLGCCLPASCVFTIPRRT